MATDQAAPRPLTIVVGVTGGIAAYKAVQIIRLLVLAGHDVHVIATQAALRFVGKPTLEAISRNPVRDDLYEGVAEVRHVALGQSAELIVIAPATANTIAKLSVGLADDLLGTTVLASTAPVVIAPAMHTEMWQNPATQSNVTTLARRGVTIIGPGTGQLTGADTGPGRMEEPERIVEASLAVAAASRRSSATASSGNLNGRRILVTAGGTREALDPVRFLGNRSSGRQGVALARAAHARGADVTLIGANLEVAVPEGISFRHAESAQDLAACVTELAPNFDVVIMAAAVADYRPADFQKSKIKKETTGDTLTLELVRNPDILVGLTESRAPGQTIIGFAAETENDPALLLELGRSKLRRKKCDFLVVNQVGSGLGFATEDNKVTVLDAGGSVALEAQGSKLSVADRILDLVITTIDETSHTR